MCVMRKKPSHVVFFFFLNTYLSQKLSFTVGLPSLGIRHHLSQLRFILFGFNPAAFAGGGGMLGSTLRSRFKQIRVHCVARNALRRNKATGIQMVVRKNIYISVRE